jgi:hypothetical protein
MAATPLSLVVVDAMSFVHLQALGQPDLLRAMGARTRRLAVTQAVLRRLRRSPRLGPLAQSYCDRRELTLVSPRAGDAVSSMVSAIVGTPGGNIVRRDRADGELIAVAALHDGALLSAERRIQALAQRRSVPVLDLVALLVWALRLGVVSEEGVARATAPWATPAGAATGAPPGCRGSVSATVRKRGARFADLLDALPADPESRGPGIPLTAASAEA